MAPPTPAITTTCIHDMTSPRHPSVLQLILATMGLSQRDRIRVSSSIEKHTTSASPSSGASALLAWGTTVGVGLLLLKVLNNNNQNNTDNKQRSSTSSWLWHVFSELIGLTSSSNKNESRRTNNNTTKRSIPSTPKPSSQEEVLHQGSCHCGSIAFEVRLLKILTRSDNHVSNLSFSYFFLPRFHCLMFYPSNVNSIHGYISSPLLDA